MFRAGFHTGYVPVGVLRLTKAQLDGPSVDPRFEDDFFIDLIFAPVVELKAGDPVMSPATSNKAPTDLGLKLDRDTTEACEEFMHRDERFWEAVSSRKLKSRRRTARKFFTSSSRERFSIGGDDIHIPDEDNTGSNSDAGRTARQDSITRQAADTAMRISDEDLILALSEATEESGSRTHQGSQSTPSAKGANLPDDLSFLEDMDFKTPGSSRPAANTVGGQSSELKTLQDFEDELGLGDFSISPHGRLSTEKITQLQSVVEDDIDELEKYLQSLSAAPVSK